MDDVPSGMFSLPGFTHISAHFHQARGIQLLLHQFSLEETRACSKISAGFREHTAKEKAPQNSLTLTAEEAGAQLTPSICTEQGEQQE